MLAAAAAAAAGFVGEGKAAEGRRGEREKKKTGLTERASERETENKPRELPRALGSGKRSTAGESTAMPRRKQQAPKRAAGKKPTHSFDSPRRLLQTFKPSPPPPHFFLTIFFRVTLFFSCTGFLFILTPPPPGRLPACFSFSDTRAWSNSDGIQ